MGELRDRMVRDMDVRHFSGRTVEAYVAGVKGLAKYYMRPPDQLSDDGGAALSAAPARGAPALEQYAATRSAVR